mmetsp:Transcript_439/g.700  ORF Transcript_439/g.700 Transcript_439/m.700 type:complete len:85 (-) Transcript_439:344-598(-)
MTANTAQSLASPNNNASPQANTAQPLLPSTIHQTSNTENTNTQHLSSTLQPQASTNQSSVTHIPMQTTNHLLSTYSSIPTNTAQ